MRQPKSLIIPTAPQMERAILGAMLVDSMAYYKANNQQQLIEDDFTDEFNKLVYKSMQAIVKENGKIDLMTVAQKIMPLGGDVYELSKLTERVGSSANLEHHVQCLKQVTMRRSLLFSANKTMSMAGDAAQDIFELIETAQKDIMSITEGLTSSEEKTENTLQDIADIALGFKPYKRHFVHSGLQSLEDAGLYGIEQSDICTIGADAGVGKTALALNLAIRFLEQDKHIAFFSYEMSPKDLILRIISIKTGLTMREIQEGNLDEADKQLFSVMQDWMREKLKYLHCFDCAGMTIESLRAKCLSLHYSQPLQAVFIDYVQLIAAPPKIYDANVKQEYNCEKLQHLKKQIGCAFVLLSQLRKGKTIGRPTAGDLKGAQVLEAMSTKIILLDSLEKRGTSHYEDGTPTMGKIDVYVDKNRNGRIFNQRVDYIGYCYKFQDENTTEILEAPF